MYTVGKKKWSKTSAWKLSPSKELEYQRFPEGDGTP